ncbi:MAG TPA: phosphonate metabolism transcriptional regulator PhnF [Acetobacteraceae bacterium]|nr:phosphonate metabolism transcriptional regulator PhnF [Acetobacteraceae bacterium]
MTAEAAVLAPREGVARWRQIANALSAEIGEGAYKPGSRLPTEAELAHRFGVNRHTVRHAMEELSRAGLVRVEQGRGAFVPEDVLDYVVAPRTRFSEWIRRHNKEPSGRIIRLGTEPASPAAAAALGVSEGAPLVVLHRLGLADARPVSLGSHHFPPRLAGIAEALARMPSITEALRAVGVADYLRQVTRVTAALPTTEEAALLQMPRSRPVLVTENINVDGEGRVVEFGLSRYPTPRVQIVVEP